MKKYLNAIIISSILLLIFPFLGFPELWENFYVILIGFVIALSGLFLRHKAGIVEDHDSDTSLQEYVKELQERFKDQVATPDERARSNRISEVQSHHD
ncbi:hypothetical protein KC866_04150 [Patescibacteria group bacterium]|nr:hypothetical protein [Patescibacteria group bacterium]